MPTINNIGTKFYGECDYRLDGTFVMTKWFVVCFVPLIPLYSARMYPTHVIKWTANTKYRFKKQPIHWKQVFRTWSYFFTWVFGVCLLVILMETLKQYHEVLGRLMMAMLFGFGLTMVLLPNYLRYHAKLEVGFDPDDISMFGTVSKSTVIMLAVLLGAFAVFMWFVRQ